VDDPCIIRMIFHGARFIHTSKALDTEEAQRLSLAPTENQGIAVLLAAITQGQTQAAIGMTAAWLQSGEDVSPLQAALEDLVIQDPVTRPIFVAHAIKGTIVAFEEHAVTKDPMPVLALVRFLSSPMQERTTAQRAQEAIAFVTEGKVPRQLA